MSERHPHRRRLLSLLRGIGVGVVAAALLAAGCSSDPAEEVNSATTSTEPSAATTPECDGTTESPDPQYLVDDCGRVLILRGVNVESSSKSSEDHLPTSGIELQERLADWGWNNVRFLLQWAAVEPTAGSFDDAYLEGVEEWLDWYADHGYHVVLDFHQDLYGAKVGGNGAPDWAVITDGLEFASDGGDGPWYLAATDPATQAAYQNFWDPERGHPELQEHYWGAWQHVIERFADHPAVIGYDLMNEPVFANGDLTETLAVVGEAAAGEFQNPILTSFMVDGIDAVREVDDDGWIFIELTSLLNAFPYATDLLLDELVDPRDGPPRLVYAGHLYEFDTHDGLGYPIDSTYVADWERFRVSEADEFDAALWIGEWGGPADQDRFDEYVVDVTNMADRHHAGWAWWSWDPGGWGPLTGDGERSAVGDLLMRVQPLAVAGTPRDFSWDAGTLTFEMTWDERDDAEGPTIIGVPEALFGGGISVKMSDDDGTWSHEWDAARGHLLVSADRTVTEHHITITAAAE